MPLFEPPLRSQILVRHSIAAADTLFSRYYSFFFLFVFLSNYTRRLRLPGTSAFVMEGRREYSRISILRRVRRGFAANRTASTSARSGNSSRLSIDRLSRGSDILLARRKEEAWIRTKNANALREIEV